MYKKCRELRKFLWRLLKVVWWKNKVSSSWNKAEGVYILKEKGSSSLGQFQPISLLFLKGKIMFGILAERMSPFLLKNGFTLLYRKWGNQAFQVVWNIPAWSGILSRKQSRDLSVVWLDLPKAYGPVPHALIEYAMDFFWIPEKVKDFIVEYYEGWLSDAVFDTRKWVELEVGIPMGCTISPILFVLEMEVIIGAAEKVGPAIASREGEEFPPLRAFMDDLTLLNPSEEAVVAILTKLEELMNWGRMKFKTKKSRSLVFKKGKLVDAHFFAVVRRFHKSRSSL